MSVLTGKLAHKVLSLLFIGIMSVKRKPESSSESGEPIVLGVSRTGRVRKKSAKLLQMDDDDFDPANEVEEDDDEEIEESEPVIQLPKPARSRKKSAKVLEMEQVDEMKTVGKKTGKSLKIKDIPTSPVSHTSIQSSPPTSASVTPPEGASVIKFLLGSPAEKKEIASSVNRHPSVCEHPTDTISKKTPKQKKIEGSGEQNLKLKFHLPLGGTPSVENSAKVKKTKIKKELPDVSPSSHSPEKSDIFVKEGDGGIKLKFVLSPKERVMEEDEEKPIKKKKRPKPDEDGMEGWLTPEDRPKKKKKAKLPKETSPISPEKVKLPEKPVLSSLLSSPPGGSVPHLTSVNIDSQLAYLGGQLTAIKQESIKVEDQVPESGKSQDPQYSDIQEMGSKVKTSSEKKAIKKRGRKPKIKNMKKRRAPTAYTLWCNTVRSKVVSENPGIEFAAISRRLGEIWQSIPGKDKTAWKRKAKRLAMKGAGLISTGKDKTGILAKGPGRPLMKTGGVWDSKSGKYQPAVNQQPVSYDDSGPTVLGTLPVDVAAHLKLLGESLSIIGARLQEHQGQIAVQGSLSVLLDSMLCALGPLTCLTSQVSEINGCHPDTLSEILDNIAYIMPGL